MTTKDVPMTGGTAGRVTPWTSDKDAPLVGQIVCGDEKIAQVYGTGGVKAEERTQLIVAAVNAMFALNPSDPLAAAQHLEALVKAVGAFLRWNRHGNRDERFEARVFMEVALSHVTGKP